MRTYDVERITDKEDIEDKEDIIDKEKLSKTDKEMYAWLKSQLRNLQKRSSLKVTQKFNIIHTLSPAEMPGFFNVSAQFLCRSLSQKGGD